LGTFNISTAAALVTAAAGVPVAKHGNRRASSLSGSADVLAALGVNVEASLERVEACLDTLGICFCFAPLFHASMKHVAAVRRQLGFPTIFNLLGPLVNPAGAEFQLIGVGRAEVRPLVAEALARLGTKLALVVHGDDGLDELSIAGPSMVSEARPGSVREFRWAPTDFCLAAQPGADLRVAGPEESAAMIRQVLAGNPGPARDVVVLNAGAALWTAGQHEHKLTCAAAAAEAIDNGAAAGLLARLAEFSHA
jgi:anthranilate phosphoribosyltransferase